MDGYELAEAAERSGITVDELAQLVELGIVVPSSTGRFSPGDLRRAGLVTSLVASGIPLEALGAAVRNGSVSLAYLDAPAFDRFSAYSTVTFADLAERTGLPVELVLFARDVTGSVPARPSDRVRDEELPLVDLLRTAVEGGIRPVAIQQLARTSSDSLRRVAETEAAMWQTDVVRPAMERGMRPDEILGAELGDRMSELSERSVLALYHLQQARAWTENLIEGVEAQLAAANIHRRLAHPPAMCFLDITGYTRLTRERGDAAAAQLAEDLGRVVRSTSVHHGGRPVKWLGDGVMVYFPIPGSGVAAALDMIDAIVGAGLPPAHVGLHAGPVIFQEGDYYGQTVNLAARIADVAAAGQVLVSEAVVGAAAGSRLTFREVGPVELKGVDEPMTMFAASRAR